MSNAKLIDLLVTKEVETKNKKTTSDADYSYNLGFQQGLKHVINILTHNNINN